MKILLNPCKKCIVRAMCKEYCLKKYEHRHIINALIDTARIMFVFTVLGLLWALVIVQTSI